MRAGDVVDDFIATLVARLSRIGGLVAVALGGSYARGTQRPDSDIDLGLYYREASPFSIEDIKNLAEEINDAPRPIVTDFWRWGRWVNGGAWLTVKGQRVDFLYRSLDHLERVIEDCRRGSIESDFYQQAPYGFHSYIYLGELSVCRVLHDPQGVLAQLKESVIPYPQPLKKAIVSQFLWGVEFDLEQAGKFAEQGDVYNATGCLTRCASALVQVVYALNERYFINDKGSMREIAAFELKPADFVLVLARVLARPGQTSDELTESVSKLAVLLQQLLELCGDLFARPDFRA
jgi:predicted nucleotidyltransferase